MFDGDTYSGYVVRDAPRRARELLAAMETKAVRDATVESLVERLVDEVAVVPVSYEDVGSGQMPLDESDLSKGVEVRLRLSLKGAPSADKFLSFTPTHRANIRIPMRVEQPYLIAVPVPATEVARTLDALRANIEQLGKDVAQEEGRLREHLRNVVESRKREITAADAAEAARRAALQASGVPILTTEPDDRPHTGAGSAERIPLTLLEPARLSEVEVTAESLRVTEDGSRFLSSVAAKLAENDPKAFQTVVTDTVNRMQAIERNADLYELSIRMHAAAAAASLEIVAAGVVGEIPIARTKHALRGFIELVAELAALGVQFKHPELALVIKAGLLINRYVLSHPD